MSSFDVVLDIPIPQCVQARPRPPPVCLPSQGDVLAINLLTKFGHDLRTDKNEINQACNLAAGLSDVVIIIERPHNGNYNTSFDKLVEDCMSLRAVDDLIRFASKGARSIHTVTVLDAFSYQPLKDVTTFDGRCHQLLADMLKVKKPKVVIRCHTGTYQNEWMRRFELPAKNYKLVRRNVGFDDGHRTIVFQSFHPSCAVNYAQRIRPEYRALLIHHFVAAFAELHGQSQLPRFAERIREICLQRQPGDTGIESWQAASCICHWVEKEYHGPDGVLSVEFAEDEPHERFQKRERHFSKMNCCLQRLAEKPCTCGTLTIARILLYWIVYFRDDPLYEQVTSLLRHRGSEQLKWFPSSVSNVTRTEPFSFEQQFLELHISRPPDMLYGFNGEACQGGSEAKLPKD